MMFEIDLLSVIEIVFIVLTLKIILNRWHPPLQESLQSIIAICLGTLVGCFINPNKDGFILGIIISAISFYGKDILREFTSLKNDLKDADIDLSNKSKVKDELLENIKETK